MDRAEESGSLERLNQVFPATYDNYRQLVLAMQLMVHLRVETLSLLHQVADDLDARHREVNLAKVAGAATGVIGSATTAVGVMLIPFTSGASTLLIAAGSGAVVAAGVTAVGAHAAEKVLEKVDLTKLQQALDRDTQQCERVRQLWKEFESYSVDIVNTIALAEPTGGSGVKSYQEWVQKALETVVEPVRLIADTCFEYYRKVKDVLDSPTGQELLRGIGKVANYIEKNPKLALRSEVARTWKVIAGLVVPAVVFVAGIVVLIKTAMDIHKGSLSKVAQDLREKGKELQKGLETWLQMLENSE